MSKLNLTAIMILGPPKLINTLVVLQTYYKQHLTLLPLLKGDKKPKKIICLV